MERDGPKPDPHLMAMPPAASGHDYIGTAANQVYIRLGQPALSRSSAGLQHLRWCSIRSSAPSGAFESRLWQELRQKRGLVYSVNSTLEADGDRGDLRVELNASPQRVVDAVTLVRQELKRLQEEPVTQTELQEAKVRLVSNALLEESSSSGQAKQILDIADNRLPLDYYSTLNERYERITAADVQRVATRVLAPRPAGRSLLGALGPVGGAHAMIETIDPATGEVLERIEPMSPERIEAKLAAAARAFEGWRATSFDRRADLLQGVAARFRDERERLAATAVREMGKPLVQARAEVEQMRVGTRLLCGARRSAARGAAGGIDGYAKLRRVSSAGRAAGDHAVELSVLASDSRGGAGHDGRQRSAAQAREQHDALRLGDRARL